MDRKTGLSLLVISCLINYTYTSITPFIKWCNANDHECLFASNMQIAMSYLSDGITELEVPPTEPMVFKNITVDQGEFKLFLPTMEVFGSRKCRIVNIKRNRRESSMKLTLDCPLEISGKYIFKGKICFFDINKEGDFMVQTDSIRTTITTNTEEIYGDDRKKYLKLNSYEYFYEPLEKINVELADLFKGSINKDQTFLRNVNYDWYKSFTQAAEPIASTAVKYFHDVLKIFFLHVSIDQLE